MRRRRLKRLWASLHELRNRKSITRDEMIDIHLPTTDGRHIVMGRYTQHARCFSAFGTIETVAS